jgi:hypothetical protein
MGGLEGVLGSTLCREHAGGGSGPMDLTVNWKSLLTREHQQWSTICFSCSNAEARCVLWSSCTIDCQFGGVTPTLRGCVSGTMRILCEFSWITILCAVRVLLLVRLRRLHYDSCETAYCRKFPIVCYSHCKNNTRVIAERRIMVRMREPLLGGPLSHVCSAKYEGGVLVRETSTLIQK